MHCWLRLRVHMWDGCVCRRCTAARHDWELIKSEIESKTEKYPGVSAYEPGSLADTTVYHVRRHCLRCRRFEDVDKQEETVRW